MTGGKSNRTRGDYFERQTRDTLRAHSWIVVRAAGSLGVADLVALRAGFTPLLISCKTNGTIGPAERSDLVAAATAAAARPILASKSRRGYVDLSVVTATGVRLIDEIKTPPRTDGTDDENDGADPDEQSDP